MMQNPGFEKLLDGFELIVNHRVGVLASRLAQERSKASSHRDLGLRFLGSEGYDALESG